MGILLVQRLAAIVWSIPSVFRGWSEMRWDQTRWGEVECDSGNLLDIYTQRAWVWSRPSQVKRERKKDNRNIQKRLAAYGVISETQLKPAETSCSCSKQISEGFVRWWLLTHSIAPSSVPQRAPSSSPYLGVVQVCGNSDSMHSSQLSLLKWLFSP